MTLGLNRIGIAFVTLISIIAGCVRPDGYPTAFTLEFPRDIDLGELRLLEDVNCFTCGNGEKDLGRAIGKHNIRLPAAHWYVSLKMSKNASSLLPHLAHPSLANIGDINLAGSNINDNDLRYIEGINLRSINLSKTKITGEGFKYLKPHSKWIFVELAHCDALNPAYLSHFKGWKRSTIRLVPYKWSGDTYSDGELRLLNRAKQIICDDQPENICGTQIR
jgi:hypothetical protein